MLFLLLWNFMNFHLLPTSQVKSVPAKKNHPIPPRCQKVPGSAGREGQTKGKLCSGNPVCRKALRNCGTVSFSWNAGTRQLYDSKRGGLPSGETCVYVRSSTCGEIWGYAKTKQVKKFQTGTRWCIFFCGFTREMLKSKKLIRSAARTWNYESLLNFASSWKKF